MRNRRHYPSVYNAYEFATGVTTHGVAAGLPDGRWVPARAEGWHSWTSAVRIAWMVYRGYYDALVWPGQGDKP